MIEKPVYEKDSLTQQPYRHYLACYQETSPYAISQRLHLPYREEEKAFFIRFLGVVYKVTYPEFEIIHQTEGDGIYLLETDIKSQILLLRYLVDGDGEVFTGSLLSYHDLPWGEVYYRQFYGRCIMRLARTYGKRIKDFCRIMEGMNGVRKSFGDAAYEFELMEGLHLCFILWEGDDEFQPSAQILFSDNFPAAFSAEDVAYVGDIAMEYMKQYAQKCM